MGDRKLGCHLEMHNVPEETLGDARYGHQKALWASNGEETSIPKQGLMLKVVSIATFSRRALAAGLRAQAFGHRPSLTSALCQGEKNNTIHATFCVPRGQ